MGKLLEKLPPHHLVPRISSRKLDQEDNRISHEIGIDWDGLAITLVTILWGGDRFKRGLLSNLAGLPNRPSRILLDTIRVESYGNEMVTNRKPEIVKFPDNPEETIAGQNVLLVEDIVDSGLTIAKKVLPYVLSYHPKSLCIATMLTKNQMRDPEAENLPIRYAGQNIGFFAVGRGLDWKQAYRNLEGISEVVEDK